MPDESGLVSVMNEGSYLNVRRIRGGPDGLVVVGSPALERVMAAGIDLFYESGFLATTIRAITGACGLTAPAYYNHFESKEALLYTIISDANSVLESQLEKLDLENVAPAEALQLLVKVLVEFNLTWPKDARIANREYGFLQPPLREEVIEHRRRVRSLFETVLAAPGLPRGLLPAGSPRETQSMEVRLLAISIINLCISSSDWFRSEGPLSVEAVCDTYCRLALRMARLDEPRTLAMPEPDTRAVPRFRLKRT
jgi:TetR/AcrR family transcriptional regulator, cholesterol catabolism regulator